MNTKLLLLSSAVVMAVCGVSLQFAPQEILARFGADTSGIFPLVLQLVGALYLGFAMMNYTAREANIGGIYSRPLAIGNLTHFIVGALALIKYAVRSQNGGSIWIAA